MTNVAVYSKQPMLMAGFASIVAGLEDCRVSGVFTALDSLMEHIRTSRPSVVLIDMTGDVTMSTLSKLTPTAGESPVILWVDSASTEFASEALALGVRGFLRKSLPVELQIRCLRRVAAGDLWVEQALCEQLFAGQRVLLTPRERQIVSLLAQGLKNKEIAYSLTLSEGTVKVYLSRIFQKVGVTDRLELVLFALNHSLVGPTAHLEPPSVTGSYDGRQEPSCMGNSTRQWSKTMGTPQTHGTFHTTDTEAPKIRSRQANVGMPPADPHCSQSLWALMNTPKSLGA
jgi:two-component system, NarL family, nitrate/nitrite response regulator NarL